MMSHFTNLNWTGVVLAFAAYATLGALWFTLFFRKQYQISLGRENETLQNNQPVFIIGPALCSLVITVTSAVLLQALKIESLDEALAFALLIGVGYLLSNTINIAINPNMPRPFHYSIITGLYHLTGIAIVSIILTAI